MSLEDRELDPKLIEQVETLISNVLGEHPESSWRTLCERLKSLDVPPSVYRSAWDRVFQNWDATNLGPAPMWVPSEAAGTNLGIWMDQIGITEYKPFWSWAAKHRSDFWEQAIERVGISFETEPSQVLDTSEGIEHAKWLNQSRFNIAESCFDAPPDQIAIIEGSVDGNRVETSYGELNQKVDQVAASLLAAGYQSGDAIAVFMPMTSLSVVIYLAMVRIGVAVVSIADSFAPPEIENRLRIANAKAVFTYDQQVRTGRVLPLYASLVEATQIPAIVIPLGEQLTVELREQDLVWEQFLGSGENVEPYLAGPNHIVNILFSSGTTGDPKAIPWTQLTPIKCAVDGYCFHDLQPGDVVCWPTNLGWMMGPWLIFATLINRGTIALFGDAPMSAEFGQFVQDAKVNMLGVVPTIVKAWRTLKAMEQWDWSAIKVFSSTGESSQVDDMFYLSSLAQMKPVIEYCGGTEIGGAYITSTVVQNNAPATFSTPALGLELELLDESGRPTNDGELFIVPPSIGLSSSLLNRDHHETYFAGTPDSDRYPVLRRHGDHIRELPGGYYVAGGRVDDTMNLGGIKTSSAELERVMNQIDGVKETAAVAISESGGPNTLTVFAVLDEELDKKKLKVEMNKRIRTQLNPLFKVKSVHVLDSMPRTASGKVMRRKLRDQLTAADFTNFE